MSRAGLHAGTGRQVAGYAEFMQRNPAEIEALYDDSCAAIREILEGEGVEIRLSAECITVAPHAAGVAVGLRCDDAVPEVVGSRRYGP